MVGRYWNKGFSLIELMIAVAIIGLLLVTSIPFTGAWSTSSHIQSARGNLMQAHAQAKAVALRGHAGQLVWDNSTGSILACQGLDPCHKDSEQLLWSAKNPPGTSLTVQGMAVQPNRLLLDSRGRPLNLLGEYMHSVSFTIAKKDDSDELTLH